MAATQTLGLWRFERAGNLDPNPTNFASRAQGWAQGSPDGTVLLVTKTDGVLADYMIAPKTPVERSQAHMKLANAVAARAVADVENDVDVSEILNTPAYATLAFERGAMMNRDPIIGADVGEISRQLAVSLNEGDWVAISMRRPTKREMTKYRRWLSGQLGSANPQHASLNAGNIIAQVWAGAETQDDADARVLALASALRGFDVPVLPRKVSRASGIVSFFGALVLGAGLGTLGLVDLGDAPAALTSYQPIAFSIGAVSGVLGLGGIVGKLAGFLPSDRRALDRAIDGGTLPAPRAKRGRVRKPTKERIDRKTGNYIEATLGDYPLDENAFLHAAEVFAGMVAPHSGADSGTTGVSERKAIAELRETIGFRLGENAERPVFLSAMDLRQSCSIFGRRGSGKSYLTHGIWSFMSLDKQFPTGRYGYTGAQNTMIAFETKSWGGSEEYIERSRIAGITSPNVLPSRFDLADPNGLAVDVFDLPGFSVRDRAEFLTGAMVYVFGEQAIQDRSKETLGDIFSASIVVDNSIASQVPGVEQDRSPFYYASILLGVRGDQLAIELATSIRSEAVRRGDSDTELRDASERVDKYFTGLTVAARATRMEAPRSKVSALLGMEHWWSRKRRVSWKTLIDHNASIIINTAKVAEDVLPGAANISDETSEKMAQFLLYSLRHSIERNCDGNAAREKWVTIFSDELSMLANESSSVITWLQDKGRSYGAICVFASQRAEQLTPDVQRAVLGFGTVIVMNQQERETAEVFSKLLSTGDNEWTEADIVNLEPRTAIVRTLYRDRAVPPYNVRIDNYFGDDYDFAGVNGFELAA